MHVAIQDLRDAPDSRFAALAAKASEQHGLIAHEQLIALGLNDQAIWRLRSAGLLHRVRYRVYAFGHLALSADAHLLGAVMTLGPQARVHGASAVLAHEIAAPWQVPDLFPVHVVLPPGVRRRRRPDVLPITGVLLEEDKAELGPLPVTSVERTLIDVATTLTPRVLERCVDQALVDGKTDVKRLRAAIARHPGRRGVGRLRRVIDTAERYAGLTRSELEAELRRLALAARFGAPVCNARADGVSGRFDALWRAERVGVEVDGWRWHRTGLRQHADRVKELDARRAGILLLRYSARQVFEKPISVVADLGAALAERRVKTDK